MLAVLLLGVAFAFTWPRQSAWLKDTSVGKVLNNFNVFWWSHMIMLAVFIVGLFLHPMPGSPQLPRTGAPHALPQV